MMLVRMEPFCLPTRCLSFRSGVVIVEGYTPGPVVSEKRFKNEKIPEQSVADSLPCFGRRLGYPLVADSEKISKKLPPEAPEAQDSKNEGWGLASNLESRIQLVAGEPHPTWSPAPGDSRSLARTRRTRARLA